MIGIAIVVAPRRITHHASLRRPTRDLTKGKLLRILGTAGSRFFLVLLAICLALAVEEPRGACQIRDSVSERSARDRSGPTSERELQSRYDTGRVGCERNQYSEQRERKLGDTLARGIESRVKVFVDPIVDDYLTRISFRLESTSDIHRPLRIRVLHDPEINAYSVPGHVYLTTGLISAVQSEAELAGAIAHELGHLVAHDSIRGVTRWQLGLPLRHFKRSSEFEADRRAVQYVFLAGYDPIAFAEFIERVWPGSSTRNYLVILRRTFEMDPPAGERTRRIRDTVLQSLPAKAQYVFDTSEFQEIKQQLLLSLQMEKLRKQNAVACSSVRSAQKARR